MLFSYYLLEVYEILVIRLAVTHASVQVVGPTDCGKSSVARILTNYAARAGFFDQFYLSLPPRKRRFQFFCFMKGRVSSFSQAALRYSWTWTRIRTQFHFLYVCLSTCPPSISLLFIWFTFFLLHKWSQSSAKTIQGTMSAVLIDKPIPVDAGHDNSYCNSHPRKLIIL